MLKKKRIFIKYLKDSISAPEIKTAFSDYGKVRNIDIKERKSFDSTCHQSRYFAYISMDIDDYNLQRCFEDFHNGLWKGQCIELQLAKENFLDQLKREREESNQINNNKDEKSDNKRKRKFGEIATFNSIKDKTIIEKNYSETKLCKRGEKIDISNQKNVSETFQESTKTEIKISGENFCKSEYREQKNVNLTPSEIKRSQSVHEMIKGYREQKLIIKTALSSVDSKPNNKIKFKDSDDNLVPSTDKLFESSQKKKVDKNTLFESDEESGNDLDDFNFEVKEAFKGKEGKKLFELQSGYKNDKRFILNKHFIDDEKEYGKDDENSKAFETNTSEEKDKQFEILEQILGSKVKPKQQHSSQQERQTKKRMLRFDPTQSDHSKYELKNSEVITKRSEITQQELVNKESRTDEIQPLVSKDVFYKVSEELKETFLEPQSFSLLSTFGKSENVENNRDEDATNLIENKKTNILLGDINPFRYDSSENEENEDLEEKDANNSQDNVENKQKNPTKLWSEPFFFRNDDFRLQEGLDFMKRIASEKNNEFVQLRRDLKNVVKAKVRNNQRKNKPFKKKLGGNKRKKMIRTKKAMKR